MRDDERERDPAERDVRLEALLADLPVVPTTRAPRSGWQQRAAAALDAAAQAERPEATGAERAVHGGSPGASADRAKRPIRSRRRVIAAGSAIAVGLAVVIIAQRWTSEAVRPGEPVIALAVESGGTSRSKQPSLGDTLVVRVRAPSAGEVRLYDSDGREQARCGGAGPGCRAESSHDEITQVLAMPVHAPGSYRVVWFASAIPGPSVGHDGDIAAAVGAGITVRTQDSPLFR